MVSAKRQHVIWDNTTQYHNTFKASWAEVYEQMYAIGGTRLLSSSLIYDAVSAHDSALDAAFGDGTSKCQPEV